MDCRIYTLEFHLSEFEKTREKFEDALLNLEQLVDNMVNERLEDNKGQTIWNFSSYETTQIILIDRVAGILNWDAGFDNDKYDCEVKKKTLF